MAIVCFPDDKRSKIRIDIVHGLLELIQKPGMHHDRKDKWTRDVEEGKDHRLSEVMCDRKSLSELMENIKDQEL